MRSHALRNGRRDQYGSDSTHILGFDAACEHPSMDSVYGSTSESSSIVIEGSSAVSDQAGGASAPPQIKRSLSQDALDPLAVDGAFRFQSITFPKRDTASTISLDKLLLDDGQEFLKNGKRLPPSKRPGVSHAKKTPPDHIKRPRNAYIIFRSHTVSQKLIPKEIEHDHRNISRIIAHMWKSLSPEDRAFYELIAKEEKEQHKALYPNYRYQPISRRTGVSKRNVKKLENGEEECQEIADIILKAQGKQGVVVRPEPPKDKKRARASLPKPSSRKRIRKSLKPESPVAEPKLAAVFLHLSPSSPPTAGAVVAMPVNSPEPLQLVSRAPSVDDKGSVVSDVHSPSPSPDRLLGRRASSVPPVRPCSPPPPFAVDVELPHVGQEDVAEVQVLAEANVAFDSELSHTDVGVSEESIMPAPSWRTKRPQPLPLANTWQHCSFDDQSLPSPRSFDSFGTADKQAMARPRTAMPSTPSSGSFRGFFHPWAFECGTESMLISPMTASFQELRRRSSLVHSGMIASRHQGHVFPDTAGNVINRDLVVDGHRDPGIASDSQMSEVQLFEQAARAAEISLGADASAAQSEDSHVFAFDPALEGEGGGPIPSALPAQNDHCGPQKVQFPVASPARNTFSPRPSFSGSTLAAAARDWASIKRRRSKLEARSVIEPVDDSMQTWCETTLKLSASRYDATQHDSNKSTPLRSSLEESVRRAVTLALGKDAGPCGNAERNKIVQQILSSLSAELSPNRPVLNEEEQAAEPSAMFFHGQRESSRVSFSKGRERLGNKVLSPSVTPSRRASLRAPYGASQFHAAGDGTKVAKSLPSPLQLVMSNHRDMSTDYHPHYYPSSQHCS